MKRFKIFTLALVLLAFFVAAPAQAELQDMWAAVYKWDGGMNSDGSAKVTRVTSGITFKVLAIDSNTSETLYYPNGSTALTNPVTTTNFESATVCNDRVAFRVDPTDSTSDRYVDLIVVDTAGGYTAFVENFDKYTHSIVIDERPNQSHHGVVWFGASTTSEVNTGVTFAKHTMVHDVAVEVITVASAISVDVGLLSSATGGATAGFRTNVLLTTAGFVQDPAVITAGTVSTDYYPASNYGAFLYTALTGSGTADLDSGGKTYLGGYVHNGTSTGVLTYQMDSTTGAGYLHYWFTRLR